MSRRAALALILLLVLGIVLPSCALVRRWTGGAGSKDGPGAVRVVDESIVVAAWTEPRVLPPGGGQAQILVRVQREGGRRFPGVEVRLHTSNGTLYSDGKLLVTDAEGMTRDRLTSSEPATITINAGGTRYRFLVKLGEGAP